MVIERRHGQLLDAQAVEPAQFGQLDERVRQRVCVSSLGRPGDLEGSEERWVSGREAPPGERGQGRLAHLVDRRVAGPPHLVGPRLPRRCALGHGEREEQQAGVVAHRGPIRYAGVRVDVGQRLNVHI
ncbi:MAG: hypothetical protein WKF76_06050 [Nocardioidaceae bacterium]